MRRPAGHGESGQALLVCLAVVSVLLVGAGVLASFGQALGGRSRHQRGADLAAMSAAGRMRADYPRLFEPPLLANGAPNPRHMPLPAYRARAQAAAVRAARRNGIALAPARVTFPGGTFAPTRVAVRAEGTAAVRVGEKRRADPGGRPRRGGDQPGRGVPMDMPGHGTGGGYDGPLAYRMGKPMRPDVAAGLRPHGGGGAPGRARALGDQRLPLRRRAGAAVRRQPQPEVGGAAGHEPAPLGHRARPRAAGRLRAG